MQVSGSSAFAVTRWSLVFSAAQTDLAGAAEAMEQLCRIYREPIYTFIRYRRGYQHHDAEDLAQGFFAHLLQHDTLKRVARGEGQRFRTFLLAVLSKFLANERDAKNAAKRGGGRETLSFDALMAEDLGAHGPAEPPPGDQVFDRDWALALVSQALDRLRKECEEQGNSAIFEQLKPCLTQPDIEGLYADYALALGMKEPAARVAAHRLRRRFGDLLRQEVAQTVSRPEEIDDELRHLLAAAAG